MSVPTLDEHIALAGRVEKQEAELSWLRGLVCSLIWHSTADTCKLLGISDSTLRRMRQRGKATYRTEGNAVQYSSAWVHEYINSRTIRQTKN